MDAKIRKTSKAVFVDIGGFVEHESSQSFKDAFISITQENGNLPIIINMKDLKFIGSTGLSNFVEVLRDFNQSDSKPKLVGVSNEFRKFLKAFGGENPLDIFDSESEAVNHISGNA